MADTPKDAKPIDEQGPVTESEKAPSNMATRWPGRVFAVVESVFSTHLNALIVLFMMLSIAVEIFSRKAFNVSFPAVVDVVTLCMLVLVFTSLSGVQRGEAHLRIDIVTERLKGKTAGFTLQLINRLLTLVISLFLCYVTVVATLKAYQHNTTTMAALLPTWPAVMFIPLGFFLISVRLIVQFKQDLGSTKE